MREAIEAAHPRVVAMRIRLPAGSESALLGGALSRSSLLQLELHLEDQPVTAVAEVEWFDMLPRDGEGHLDVGLRVLRLERGGDGPGRRAEELREALARVLGTRDDFLVALQARPLAEEILPEEERYLRAIRSARVTLSAGGPRT